MATAAGIVSIAQGQDFYVPYFKVKLLGRPLDQGVIRDIQQVSYKDNIKEIDSFEITINNWDAATRKFKYSDGDLFDPGKELELWMGYYGKDTLRLMIRGKITALRPSFPASGASTLAISGLNVLHELRTEKKTVAYKGASENEGVTDKQIAEQIKSRLGVNMDIDPAASQNKYTYILQEDEYDIIFLMQRARRIGFDLFVEDDNKTGQSGKSVIRFKPSDKVRQVTYELEYGRSLIEFKPDLSTANQVGEVTVRSWDALNKTKIEATVTRGQINVKGVGTKGNQAAIEQSFQKRKEIISTKPVETEAEAKKLAQSTLEAIAKNMLKGSGSTVGLTELRAGTLVQIKGLGERFSGKYFITATTHTIGESGYTTQFECRREET